jgi:CheY-like chemotaxis protein
LAKKIDAPPILALEDESDDLSFIRRALKKADIANPLLTATTVGEGQKLCAANPHLVLALVDVNLNGPSGLDFLEWLRAQPRPLGDTPAVIFTGSNDRTDELRATALGKSLYLGKPATQDVLTYAITAFGLVTKTAVRGGTRKWLTRHP